VTTNTLRSHGARRPETRASRSTAKTAFGAPPPRTLLQGVALVALLLGLVVFWRSAPAISIKYYQLFIALNFLLYLGTTFRLIDFIDVLRHSWTLFVGFVLLIVAIGIALAAKDNSLYSPHYFFFTIQALILIMIIGAIFSHVGGNAFRQTVAWTGPLCGLFFTYLLLSMLEFQPALFLKILADSILRGNIGMLEYTMASVFIGETADTEDLGRAQRHMLSSTLLISLYLSVMFRGRQMGRVTVVNAVWWGLMALLMLSLILLLSRAVLLAFGCTLALAMVVLAQRSAWAVVAYVGGMAIAVGGAVVSGVATLLALRFFASTESYEARTTALEDALARINADPIWGASVEAGLTTAHNLVIDAWQGTGLLGLLAALMITGWFVIRGMKAVFSAVGNRAAGDEDAMFMIGYVGLAVLFALRLMTTGFGMPNPSEVLGAALFVGFTVHLARLRAVDHDTEPAPDGRRSAPTSRKLGHRWAGWDSRFGLATSLPGDDEHRRS